MAHASTWNEYGHQQVQTVIKTEDKDKDENKNKANFKIKGQKKGKKREKERMEKEQKQRSGGLICQYSLHVFVTGKTRGKKRLTLSQ